MNKIKSSFDLFFFGPVSMTSMKWVRFFLGSTLFLFYLTVCSDFDRAFGVHGVLGYYFYKISPSAVTFKTHLQIFHFLQHIPFPLVIFLLYAALIVSSGCFAIGWHARISGIICLFLHSVFHARNEYMYWGWGELIKPFILYVIFSDSNKKEGSAWPLRLLQLHVCTMYFITSTARIHDQAWQDGSVIQEILQSSLFARFYPTPHVLIPFLKLAGFASWLLELSAPVLLWFKKIGPYVAFGLIGMHIGLEIFTLVGWWNFVMIGTLVIFLPTRWLESLQHRVYI